jgi:hypothetical protein
MKTIVTAQIRMKALVVSRLLMGEITSWAIFENERRAASQIANRRAARSASSQIGRGHQELSAAIQAFIGNNFAVCDYNALAQLCDEIKAGVGLSLRLDEFESTYVPLAEGRSAGFPRTLTSTYRTMGCNLSFPSTIFCGISRVPSRS